MGSDCIFWTSAHTRQNAHTLKTSRIFFTGHLYWKNLIKIWEMQVLDPKSKLNEHAFQLLTEYAKLEKIQSSLQTVQHYLILDPAELVQSSIGEVSPMIGAAMDVQYQNTPTAFMESSKLQIWLFKLLLKPTLSSRNQCYFYLIVKERLPSQQTQQHQLTSLVCITVFRIRYTHYVNKDLISSSIGLQVTLIQKETKKPTLKQRKRLLKHQVHLSPAC